MTLRLTTTGGTGHWRAALRAGRTTLAECGHAHRNRDSGQGAARHCGRMLMAAVRDDETAARFVTANVESAARARALGAKWTDDEARAKAEAVVAAWRWVALAHDFHIEAGWAQRNAGATCGCCRPVPA